MARVDFHILDGQSRQEALRYACRVVNKAYRAGHRVYIKLADTGHAEQLDQLLWTFSDQSFIPHAQVDAPLSGREPVIIGIIDPVPEPDVVLINMTAEVPANYAAYQRLIEIVAEEDTVAARDRYRRYRENGDELDTHRMGSHNDA